MLHYDKGGPNTDITESILFYDQALLPLRSLEFVSQRVVIVHPHFKSLSIFGQARGISQSLLHEVFYEVETAANIYRGVHFFSGCGYLWRAIPFIS